MLAMQFCRKSRGCKSVAALGIRAGVFQEYIEAHFVLRLSRQRLLVGPDDSQLTVCRKGCCRTFYERLCNDSRPESSVDVLSSTLGSSFRCPVNGLQNGRFLSGCPFEMNSRPYLLVGSEEFFPKVSVLYRRSILISPAVLPPAWHSNNVVLHISRICHNLHTGYTRPRRITTNPLQSLNTSMQLHSIVAAFRAAEINNLLITTTEMLRILNNCSAAGTPTGIAVAGTIRIDLERMWVKLHLTVYYMPGAPSLPRVAAPTFCGKGGRPQSSKAYPSACRIQY